MGFAGLGARLAAGTAVDSIASMFRCVCPCSTGAGLLRP